MYGGGMMWFGLLMMLFGLLILIGIVLLGIWAITRFTGVDRRGAGSPANSPDDPLLILQRRYARGEIDREEYERVRSDLSGTTKSP